MREIRELELWVHESPTRTDSYEVAFWYLRFRIFKAGVYLTTSDPIECQALNGREKKTKAALMAFGLYLGMNAFVWVAIHILRWVITSSIGHWLEIDKSTKDYVPGFFIVYQIILLMCAFFIYRDQVKRDSD